MSKPKRITKQQLVEAGRKLIQDQGVPSFSARNIAKVADCSTQPIYYLYASLDELKSDVLQLIKYDLNQAVFSYQLSDRPIVNACLGLNKFAADEPNLFKALILEDQLGKYFANKKVFARLKQFIFEDQQEALLTDQAVVDILLRTWIFSNGLSLLLASGLDDFDPQRYRAIIEDTYEQNLK